MGAPFLCWEITLDSHWAAIERSSLLYVSCKQVCTPACHSSAPVPCIRSVQDLAFVDLQQEMKYKILQYHSGEDSHSILLVYDTVVWLVSISIPMYILSPSSVSYKDPHLCHCTVPHDETKCRGYGEVYTTWWVCRPQIAGNRKRWSCRVNCHGLRGKLPYYMVWSNSFQTGSKITLLLVAKNSYH